MQRGFVSSSPDIKRFLREIRHQLCGISLVGSFHPLGKNQFGDEKEQSADRRVVARSQDRSPKVTDLEYAECQGKKAMEGVKGRLDEWFGEPDLLRRRALRGLFLATKNNILNI
uniref:Uncharacterized protein n=1 Tax=Solanum tuberosum TaxID=4113 RepID=M1DWE6_SOLTU